LVETTWRLQIKTTKIKIKREDPAVKAAPHGGAPVPGIRGPQAEDEAPVLATKAPLASVASTRRRETLQTEDPGGHGRPGLNARRALVIRAIVKTASARIGGLADEAAMASARTKGHADEAAMASARTKDHAGEAVMVSAAEAEMIEAGRGAVRVTAEEVPQAPIKRISNLRTTPGSSWRLALWAWNSLWVASLRLWAWAPLPGTTPRFLFPTRPWPWPSRTIG